MQTLSLLLSILASFAFASKENTDSLSANDSIKILIAQKDNRKTGYVNYGKKEFWWHDAHSRGFREAMMNNGYEYEWTISPQYERAAKRFEEGLAAVVLNGKTGYIDELNRYILLPRFEAQKFPKGFSQGLSAICMNGKYGYIDKKGEIVIEPQFEDAEQFGENKIAHVKSGQKYGAIDLHGNIIIPCEYTTPASMTIGKNLPVWQSADSLVDARLKTGYYDAVLDRIRAAERETDAKIENPRYRTPLTQKVSIADSLGKFGLKHGNQWIHAPALDTVSTLYHGYFLITFMGKQGIFDSYGRQIIKPVYDSVIYQPQEEVFIVKDHEGKFGIYDGKGCMLLPPCLDNMKDFVSGRAECTIRNVIGHVDSKGQILSSRFYGDVINASMLLSDVNERMSVLKQLIALKPTYAQAHNNLAACYVSTEKYKVAIPMLRLANRLDPDDPVIAENLNKAKEARKDKVLTATFVVVGVVASVALAAVAVVADVASVEGGGSGGGGGSGDVGSSDSSGSSGKSKGSSGGTSQGELQSQYDRAIDNIRKIKDSWSDHVGTQGEVTNRQNLNEVKNTIKKIKSRAREKGYTLRTDSLENWNP